MVFQTENSKVVLKKSWCKYSRTNVTLTVCHKNIALMISVKSSSTRVSAPGFVYACSVFGVFDVILIFLALFCGFSTGRSTPFCNIFWRGMKEYNKFITISNSVDTRGACWLFGRGYFNGQSENKTPEKAENLKFEI